MTWKQGWASQVSIFMLGFACGMVQVVYPSGFGFGPGWEPVAIARSLVSTGAYADPFRPGSSGPTAVIPPLFPAALALLMRLLGDTLSFAAAASLAAVLAQALHAALLPRVSLVFFGTPTPGVFAGILSVFAFRLMPQWDAAFTACALLLFFLNASTASWRASAASGAASGLLLLTNPATVLITAPWAIWLCVRARVPLRHLAGFTIAGFLVVLPWMMRNYRELGTFSVKDNFGMTIYASNNDCAEPGIAASIGSRCYDARHPNGSVSELQALIRLGEARYDAQRTADTVEWVRTHPAAFADLTGRRIVDFWFPRAVSPRYLSFTIWAVTTLSIPGLILLALRRKPVVWYMIAVVVVYPLLYYVVVSDVRYRYPMLWLSLLCAGYLLNELFRSFFQSPRRTGLATRYHV